MNISQFTTGYLVPIRIRINQGKYIFHDTFLYNINETETMNHIIDTIILSNSIFRHRKQIGQILIENAKFQIQEQVNIFIEVIKNEIIAHSNFDVKVYLKCDYKNIFYHDEIEFRSFLGYEPEVFANSVCMEYKFSCDCGKYLAFMIREQIYLNQKMIYLDNHKKRYYTMKLM